MKSKLIQSLYHQSISIETLAWIESALDSLQTKDASFESSKTLTDQQITRFILYLIENPEIKQEVILKLLSSHDLISKISSSFLKNYLLVHLSEVASLDRFLDEMQRIHLAYYALHASFEMRALLLKNLDRFKIQKTEVLSDLGFKAILLGNSQDLNLEDFKKLPFNQMKQLVYSLKNENQKKAKLEVPKLFNLYPHQFVEVSNFVKTL